MFSVVIPFRGELGQLHDCLDSLAGQAAAPEFEVIVVDDGSEDPVPGNLGAAYGLPLKVMREVPLGISAARNAGISHATGQVILFVDSDVTLAEDFLVNLQAAVAEHPQDSAFQADLRGGARNLVERMEDLRLRATISFLTNGDGHVDYVNTSAFAVRRSMLARDKDLFDLAAVRGEDTKVLAGLLRRGQKPRLVKGVKACHRPRLGVLSYVLKHYKIGYHTTPARDELREACAGVLMDGSGRHGLARDMLVMAAADSSNWPALPLMALAYGLERLGRISHRLLGFRHGRHHILNMPLNGVRENELVARIASSARRGEGCLFTYLTAWTLVQADRDPSMSGLFRNFDICYADGMGVVLSALVLGCGRLHKVTANSFLEKLCEQAALLDLPVALVGAKQEVISSSAQQLRSRFPALNLVGFSKGHLSDAEETALDHRLPAWNPRLVIVGMGQPLQEWWVCRHRDLLPDAVFLCVGGLFDYLCGAKPTPPRWIRKAGLEWLYILTLRPRRFWKRYLVGIPVLAWLLLKARFSKI